MGKLTLYGIVPSPTVRAVLLTLNALNIPYNFVEIDLSKREELPLEYLKKNPQHTVPALEDDGHYIYDSHAINAYLVGKYAKSDDLYPKDLLKRAQVDQRMYFEAAALFFGALRCTTRPILLENQTNVPQQKIDAIIEIYNMLEVFLKDQPYIAGDKLTIADFSFISSVTTLDALISIDPSKYKKLTAWIKRMKQLPYYEEACGKGADQLRAMIKSKNIKIV